MDKENVVAAEPVAVDQTQVEYIEPAPAASPELQAMFDGMSHADFFNIVKEEIVRRKIMYLGFGIRHLADGQAQTLYTAILPESIAEMPLEYQFAVWGQLAARTLTHGYDVEQQERAADFTDWVPGQKEANDQGQA